MGFCVWDCVCNSIKGKKSEFRLLAKDVLQM